MIVDLSGRGPDLSREADLLVVGAGIAGLVLAARLRGRNIRVIVLESGGREQTTDTHPLNHVVQLGDPYPGATDGRSRGLGGTSTRWGGALIPFTEHDLAARPYLGLPAFPVGMDAVRPYLTEVESIFGVDPGSYEEDFVNQIGATKYIPIGDSDFKARFAKWPIFKRRNVATIFRDLLQHDPNIEVWINSTLTNFVVDKGNHRIVSVIARDNDGRSLTVTAKHVAICAGAIESTRLLLLLDHEHNRRIFSECNALGRFFYDHISMPMAKINAKRIVQLNRMAAFRFVGSTMRSLRFELSPAAQQREGTGSAFGHISFKTERSSGFDALRGLLRSQQKSGRLQPALLLATMRDFPYLSRVALWRFLYKQLLWPASATYEFHVVTEQTPRVENYITLSEEKDLFGLPRAAIRWRVAPEDCKTFDVFMGYFEKYWDRHGLRTVGDLDWTYVAGRRSSHPLLADVYHPGGSTRMGTDRHSAVVDSNLRSFEIPNLWTASTAVFPSGGGANPTLTLMLFTMRLADHLSNTIKNG
ncbi:MAG: GMC oxidoreductase [Xanthobacteraceae bacterium]